MTTPNVDQLREELRSLGYLSRGIEGWFALDPWTSRTFWAELLLVALKASLIVAPFIAAPMTFVMFSRNHASWSDVAKLALLYATPAVVVVGTVVVVVALALRLQAQAAIENPRLLTLVALILTTLLELVIGAWWYAMRPAPAGIEALVGIILLAILFVVAVTTLAAALLSFSIFETKLIPHVRRRRQGALIGGAVAVLAMALLAPLFFHLDTPEPSAPEQVVLSPRHAHVAFLAVDGLSAELLSARPDLSMLFRQVAAVEAPESASPPEEWATIGTGTSPAIHGVRSVEGVRLAGSARVLQAISPIDLILRQLAPLIGVARREPLPPTARRRDYVWEVVSRRGVSAAAINWWTSGPEQQQTLISVSQESILSRASRVAGRDRERFGAEVDRDALAQLDRVLPSAPELVTIYLPTLDILLNRTDIDASRRVALSMRAMEPLVATVRRLKAAGYEVILLGMPGAGRKTSGVLASTLALKSPIRGVDLAPTLCDLFGFPASQEMGGTSRLSDSVQPRIASYGARSESREESGVSPEYYENLKSLGYIR